MEGAEGSCPSMPESRNKDTHPPWALQTPSGVSRGCITAVLHHCPPWWDVSSQSRQLLGEQNATGFLKLSGAEAGEGGEGRFPWKWELAGELVQAEQAAVRLAGVMLGPPAQGRACPGRLGVLIGAKINLFMMETCFCLML